MYIGAVRQKREKRFTLRETYREAGVWMCRDILDLGEDPSSFIEYEGGFDFNFRPELERELLARGVEYSPQELEGVFLPFFKPQIRKFLEGFRTARVPSGKLRKYSEEDLTRYQAELHPFDVRRLHYLKFGRMDMGAVEGRPWKFLNVLSCRCRDEIEAILGEMERALPPMERASYVYTSLHIQECFPGHMLRHRPFGLDLDEVDACLLRELCRLNLDERFFSGMDLPEEGALHPYLVKYAVYYFDGAFAPNVRIDEFLHEFVRRRRPGGAPPPRSSMPFQEACQVLGIPPEEVLKMGRTELTRRFRRLALKMHPDKGGDHRTFVRLKEAYELLIARKP